MYKISFRDKISSYIFYRRLDKKPDNILAKLGSLFDALKMEIFWAVFQGDVFTEIFPAHKTISWRYIASMQRRYSKRSFKRRGVYKETNMNSNFTIRVEEPRDFRKVETLTRESFWNVYHPE